MVKFSEILASDLKSVELLILFKKRFNKTCLYDWQTQTRLLDVLGIERIKEYLGENGFKVIKKPVKK